MHRPTSKRLQVARRIAVYSFMTLSVIALVVVGVLAMQGYRFNRQNNSLEQGGLVQFASQPSGANVAIGSAQLTRKTSTKITVNPGEYTATMHKDGYREWSKRAVVRAGGVLWLNYARLVPEKPTTSKMQSIGLLEQAVTSPNKKYIATLGNVHSIASLSVIEVNDSSPRIIELSALANVAGAAPEAARYTIDEWSPDSRQLLIRQTVGAAHEWFVVPIGNPSEAKQLTVFDKTKISPQSLKFDTDSSQRLFALAKNGDLYRLSLSDDALPQPIAEGVSTFSQYNDDTIIYVQKSTTQQSVRYLTIGSPSQEVTQVPLSRHVLVTAGSYFGDAYIAISSNQSLRVYRLDGGLPTSSIDESLSLESVVSEQLAAVPNYLAMMSGNRFVVAQSKHRISTYDLELSKATSATFKKPLTKKIDWIDQYHMNFIDSKGALRMIDFDGTNQQAITAAADFSTALSSDGTYLYSFVKESDKYYLQQTKMIVD